MENGVYKPPQSDLTNASTDAVPEKILKRIRYGANASIAFSALFLLLLVLLAIASIVSDSETNLPDNIDEVIAAVIILVAQFILSIGLLKKNRTCATILVLVYLLILIANIVEGQIGLGVLFATLMNYYLIFGMIGCFQYHKFIAKQSKAN